MDKIKILKLSKEGLENSIAGLSQLKPVLKRQVVLANGANIKQAVIDSKEIEEHFETAINAMVTVLAYMESVEATKAKDKIDLEDFADYLIDYATPAFDHQDRKLLLEVLKRYFEQN